MSSIPIEIQPLMTEYSQLLNDYLPNKVYGIYLYGSAALGAFDTEKSDIDYLTVIHQPLTEEDVQHLKGIHKLLKNKYPYARQFDGMYIEQKDLGKRPNEIGEHYYYYNGLKKGHWNINAVTWWILQHYPMKVWGEDLCKQDIQSNWSAVVQTMKYNLHHYWKSKVDNLFFMLADEWAEECIGTLSRIYFTLVNKEIPSKEGALENALHILPEKWNTLIMEGLRLRNKKSKESLYSSKFTRKAEIRDFYLFICNETEIYLT